MYLLLCICLYFARNEYSNGHSCPTVDIYVRLFRNDVTNCICCRCLIGLISMNVLCWCYNCLSSYHWEIHRINCNHWQSQFLFLSIGGRCVAIITNDNLTQLKWTVMLFPLPSCPPLLNLNLLLTRRRNWSTTYLAQSYCFTKTPHLFLNTRSHSNRKQCRSWIIHGFWDVIVVSLEENSSPELWWGDGGNPGVLCGEKKKREKNAINYILCAREHRQGTY